MSSQYYVNLNNEYDFKGYCAYKSIEFFQHALDTNYSISRFSLLRLLVNDIFYTPIYLVQRLIIDIAFNIFNLLNTQKNENLLNQKAILDLTTLITLQMLLPIVCQAIRISASVIGLFSPSKALQGWKLAESGEYLSYSLWSSSFQDAGCQWQEQQVYEEIVPSNAISYLGEEYIQTCIDLENDDKYIEIETEINKHFLVFLQTMAEKDDSCFCKLIDYEDAQFSKIAMSKSEQKGEQYYYLSSDVKQVLFKIYPFLPRGQSTTYEEYIRTIYEQLSIKDAFILFNHISLNLSNAFLEKPEIKAGLSLDEACINSQLTLLKDLFSQRFNFGRAHFHQALYSCNFYNPY